MAALSREELARAKFAFSIYDFEGTNKIDAFQLGNALRALNLCPSIKRISNLGGTIRRNEKMLSVDEFLAIYQEAKKDKPEGMFEDYLEVLQGYDKDRSGKISTATLSHLLMTYGSEKLDKYEMEEVIQDCGKPDDEGQLDYRKFLQRLMDGPDIKIPIAMLRATETETDSGLGTPVAPLSRKSTQRKSQDHTALNEKVVQEKLSSVTKENDISIDQDKLGDDESQEADGDVMNEEMSTKSRHSQKSSGNQRKRENSTDICPELPLDDGPASKGDEGGGEAATSSKRSSRKSTTGKRASIKDKKEGSPDVSVTSDTSGGNLMSARSSLKSGKSRSSTKTSEGKEESVKAKNQQPLISLKTDGLFGKK